MAGRQIDMTVDAAPSLELDVRETEHGPALARVRYVCSLAQRRFWVLERLDPGNPALNVAVRWQLEGDISAPRLEAAWRLVVKRHDVLRTFFVADDGEPVQVVESAIDFRVPVIDLTMLAESEATEQADRPRVAGGAPAVQSWHRSVDQGFAAAAHRPAVGCSGDRASHHLRRLVHRLARRGDGRGPTPRWRNTGRPPSPICQSSMANSPSGREKLSNRRTLRKRPNSGNDR